MVFKVSRIRLLCSFQIGIPLTIKFFALSPIGFPDLIISKASFNCSFIKSMSLDSKSIKKPLYP